MLLQLFISFFKIGVFTFGGGYAMIPLIQHEVIDNRRWIPESDFLDLLTLAQSAPGPISLNTSVFVGYRMHGYIGAIVALSGIVLPPFVIILAVAIFFADIRDNAVVDAAFKAMRPAVVALIISPVVALAKGMHKVLIVVAILVALIIWGLGISPVYILIFGAVSGLIYSFIKTKKELEL